MNDRNRSPRESDEQDYPEPERMVTPEEEAGMDLAELEEPPQAEGPRVDERGEREEPFRERRGHQAAD